MAEESTLLIVKPDAVRRGLIGEIVGRVERKGLRLEEMRSMRIDRDLAERHYDEHREPGARQRLSRVREARARPVLRLARVSRGRREPRPRGCGCPGSATGSRRPTPPPANTSPRSRPPARTASSGSADVVVVRERGVQLELVVVVGPEVARGELRCRYVALLSRGEHREGPKVVRDDRRERTRRGSRGRAPATTRRSSGTQRRRLDQ